jgi:tetratricopeptide (TPR) repeat protein
VVRRPCIAGAAGRIFGTGKKNEYGMKKVLCILMLFAVHAAVFGQHINKHLIDANKLYKQGKYEPALAEYRKSLENNNDPIVSYNLGNAYFKTKSYDEAAKTYERLLSVNKDRQLRQKTFYNQGVAFSKQNKLEESIEAYKNAVLLDPADEDARVNLQKALMELKKKQPQQQQKKEDQNKKQNKNNKQQKQPPQSNLTRKQVEQLLKALEQREQQVQQRMQQRNRTAGKEEKDW